MHLNLALKKIKEFGQRNITFEAKTKMVIDCMGLKYFASSVRGVSSCLNQYGYRLTDAQIGLGLFGIRRVSSFTRAMLNKLRCYAHL